MQPLLVVEMNPLCKAFSKLIVILRSLLLSKEELFFISSERSLNDSILIWSTLVYVMMGKILSFTEITKLLLKFQSVVCLNEYGCKWESLK